MSLEEIKERAILAINNVPIGPIYDTVSSIIVNNSSKVLISGVGKAGDSANQLVSKFNSIGVSSVFLNPLNAFHGDAGMIAKNDVLIIISNSGETDELIKLLDLSRVISDNTITIILITSSQDSSLANKSDYVLSTNCVNEISSDKSNVLGLVPTLSTLTINFIGDLLTSQLIEKSKIGLDKYKYFHHSGYLSKVVAENLKRAIK